MERNTNIIKDKSNSFDIKGMSDYPWLIKKIFGYCPLHGWFMYPYRFRNGAMYEDEEKNWECGCHYCEELSADYWADKWSDVGGLYFHHDFSFEYSRKQWVINTLNKISSYATRTIQGYNRWRERLQ